MRARHLKSNLRAEEARFYLEGKAVVGTGNQLSELFKYVGKYVELKQEMHEDEIVVYKPIEDCYFIHENKGYTEIRRRLNVKGINISRKYLVRLSRKWPLSRVLISFDTMAILRELYSYIKSNELLSKACEQYLTNNYMWDEIMPIQFDFLGERMNDGYADDDVANKIITDLRHFSVGE